MLGGFQHRGVLVSLCFCVSCACSHECRFGVKLDTWMTPHDQYGLLLCFSFIVSLHFEYVVNVFIHRMEFLPSVILQIGVNVEHIENVSRVIFWVTYPFK